MRRKKWPQVHTHTSTYTPLIPSDFQIKLECSLTSVQVCVCLETITWHASPLLPKNQEAPYRSCHHLSLSLYCLFSCTCPPPHTHTHLKQTLSLFNPFHLISCPRSFAPANFLIVYISGNISDLRFSSFRLCLAVGFIPIIIKSTRGASLGFRCPFRQPHHSPPRFRRRKLSAGSDGVRWQEGTPAWHSSHEFHIISGTLEVLEQRKHTHNTNSKTAPLNSSRSQTRPEWEPVPSQDNIRPYNVDAEEPRNNSSFPSWSQHPANSGYRWQQEESSS